MNRRWAELSLEEKQYHEPQYLTKTKLETLTGMQMCENFRAVALELNWDWIMKVVSMKT